MKYLSIVFFSILCMGCNTIHRGEYNDNNQYVPVSPQYKLKNKTGFVPPSDISLPALFKLKLIEYRGQIQYPVNPSDPQAKLNPMYNIDMYILLLENGRCMSFSSQSDKQLTKADLDPTNEYYSQQYYFPYQQDQLIMENFVSADGTNQYVYFIYELSEANKVMQVVGESKNIPNDLSRLTPKVSQTKRVYERIELPSQFDFPIDW